MELEVDDRAVGAVGWEEGCPRLEATADALAEWAEWVMRVMRVMGGARVALAMQTVVVAEAEVAVATAAEGLIGLAQPSLQE